MCLNDKTVQAHTDALTEVYSRNYLNSAIIFPETGEWREKGRRYSLLILDIDKFKNINDKFGQDIGDAVLKAVADILKKHIKEYNFDRIIRYGGDEFIILYNNISNSALSKKAYKIAEAVKNTDLGLNPKPEISISIGGAYHKENEKNDYYSMLKKADENLYIVKEKKGNGCMV